MYSWQVVLKKSTPILLDNMMYSKRYNYLQYTGMYNV